MANRTLEHDWFSRPLPANVVLRERSWLYSSYAFVHCQSHLNPGITVGHGCGIYNGTFFELGPEGSVRIGDYCSLVGAIIASNHRVTIGSYTLIAHEVVIADDDCSTPEFPAVARETSNTFSRDIEIGENVWVGAGAIILGGARVGDGAVIGAATIVRDEVPAYSIYAGNPGCVVRQLRPASSIR
jgi:acetyltransferase-like isoleucine patch superfamily enzyme